MPAAPNPTVGGGMRLLALYHPGYVIRGAYPENAYARDFARRARLVRGLDGGGRPGAPD